MEYLEGAPKVIFTPMFTEILDEKPKDVLAWMETWLEENKNKLKKACVNLPTDDQDDSDSENEEEKEERLKQKEERFAGTNDMFGGTTEILEEEEEEGSSESFGNGDPHPQPNF